MISIFNQPNKKINPKDILSCRISCLILKEAQKKEIDCQILFHNKLPLYLQLKKEKEYHWVSPKRGYFNSKFGCDLALSKYLTYQVLESGKLPTPQYTKINKVDQIDQIKISGPWVIKPISQAKGQDVVIKIKTKDGLKKYARQLFKRYRYLMIEQFIKGKDYRLLILDKKLIGAVRRIPARIKGDGIHNIKQLIELSNKKERRIRIKELAPSLRKIKIDSEIKRCLAQKKLKLSFIPKKNQVIQVRKNANFSTGGEAEDVTKLVHPDNIKIARRAIRALGLKIGGVDIITKDISKPIDKNKGKIIEINAVPSLWIHHFPNHGLGHNVAGKIIDYLFRK